MCRRKGGDLEIIDYLTLLYTPPLSVVGMQVPRSILRSWYAFPRTRLFHACTFSDVTNFRARRNFLSQRYLATLTMAF